MVEAADLWNGDDGPTLGGTIGRGCGESFANER
jgi:hypothetical protein